MSEYSIDHQVCDLSKFDGARAWCKLGFSPITGGATLYFPHTKYAGAPIIISSLERNNFARRQESIWRETAALSIMDTSSFK
jgi:hypothetical protein